MKNLVIAAHEFHDTRHRLPPATIGHSTDVSADEWFNDATSDLYWKAKQNSSSALHIFPWLDRNSVGQEHFVSFENSVSPIAVDWESTLQDFNRQNPLRRISWQAAIPGVLSLAREEISSFRCPEDALSEEIGQTFVTTQPCKPSPLAAISKYDLSADIGLQFWNGEDTLGLTNYTACMGAMGGLIYRGPEQARWIGVMTPGTKITLETIADGTSRTLMYAETIGQITDGQCAAKPSWIWGGGARVCGSLPYNVGEHPGNPEIAMLGDVTHSCGAGFGSRHKDVVVFAACDGAVRKLHRDINWVTLYEFAGKADGGSPI